LAQQIIDSQALVVGDAWRSAAIASKQGSQSQDHRTRPDARRLPANPARRLRHQERQANERKTVQEEYGSQGVGTRLTAQGWPEVLPHDDRPGDKTDGDAYSKQGLSGHL